jgi:hypothetical protein
MKEANINEEIEKMGGMLRYFENKAVLGALQRADLNMLGKHRYDDMLFASNNLQAIQTDTEARFPLEDAARYMKFAVAAYGDNGILSANLDVNHAVDLRKGDMTKVRISEHTGIPCEDIEVMGVDYGEEPNHLSHFVAVDHACKKIVLAIRGTHEKRLLLIDGLTKEFLGGQAHKGIATMTENLWKGVGYIIIRLLHENPWYELVVTGHSLGGGVAVLLNMLLHKDERIRGHNFRCFAYGAPPVFCPVPSVPSHIASTCVVIVNQFDKVPFTCGDSVRHQTALINVVEHMDLDLMQRARLVLGVDTPNAELVRQIHSMQDYADRVLPDALQHVPCDLGHPAAAAIWLLSDDKEYTTHTEMYSYILVDPQKMAKAGLFVHKNEFNDHLPARYEHVLSSMAMH